MRLVKLIIAILLLVNISGCANVEEKKLLDPKNPVRITFWHYYNGPQKIAFDNMVSEFNASVGIEEGIIVEAYSQGSIDELIIKVQNSLAGKIGSEKTPNAFTAYADTAYDFDTQGYLASLNNYISEAELAEYIPSYIEEGYLTNDTDFKIFPIAKATESFNINITDFTPFMEASGTSLADLLTLEGIVAVAEQYYEYTDALTPTIDNDGKAFFGRDAMANYMLIGAMQLGLEILEVSNNQPTINIDKAVMRKLWEMYYVPFVSGHFYASRRYRSDDAKTGAILALIGSTSGAYYFPTQVSDNNDEVYEINRRVLPLPIFEGGAPYAVQQGAGMVVLKGSEAEEYASTLFMKWFTEAERNIEFALSSGYLPVKKAANDINMVKAVVADKQIEISDWKLEVIEVAINTVNSATMYTTKAFEAGSEKRHILENSLSDIASKKREELLARLAKGERYKTLVNELTSDKEFEEWFSKFVEELNS